MFEPPTEEEKTQRLEVLKRALYNATQRANVVVDSLKKNPEQVSLGKAIQKGTVGGFLPSAVRQPLGGVVQTMAPMDELLGGAAQGDVKKTAKAGVQMGAMLGGNYVLDKALKGAGRAYAKYGPRGPKPPIKPPTPTREFLRDKAGKFTKEEEKIKYISDLRND